MLGVVRSLEFQRIEALPRRKPEAFDLNSLMRRPDAEWSFTEIQSLALSEFHRVGGLFLSAPVGSGKGPLAFAFGALTEYKADEILIVVPAKTLDQMKNEVYEKARSQFFGIKKPVIVSYEFLQTPKRRYWLMERDFKLLIFDEAHYLKNTTSTRTKRFWEYRRERPDAQFVFMTGTITRKSLKDFAHLLEMALDVGSPLPRREYYMDLQDWALAIDVDVPQIDRKSPGALRRFCEGKETVRAGLRRRIAETPGVLLFDKQSVDVPLTIQIKRNGISIPSPVKDALKLLRDRWETPCGEQVADPLDYARKVSEIVHGFYYIWDPAAPPHWLAARSDWKRWVREKIKHNRRGFDSEALVTNAVRRGEFGVVPEYDIWQAVRDDFEPNTLAKWISPYLIQHAGDWARKTGGVVWNTHAAVETLWEEITGLPYFGGGNEEIRYHKGPCGASLHSHKEGKNLQQFSQCLYLQPPGSGLLAEQSLGRFHRKGQRKEVKATVLLHVPEFVDKWNAVLNVDVPYLEQIAGAQKLNVARFVEIG